MKSKLIVPRGQVLPLQTFRNRTAGRLRTAEPRKKCRARLCIPGLAQQFFVILPSCVFHPSFCVRSLLRTFALIVCAQPFCAGNATVICHASLQLTGPEDKHGVENAGQKNFRLSLPLWIIGDPYFFNHESLTLLTIYKI